MLDTVKTRQSAVPPGRADRLVDIILPDHEGNEVRLGNLWRDRLVVLVWLRHYG